MKKSRSHRSVSPEPLPPRPWFHAALGCLLGLTVFLSGEQVERSGVFHLPCILWLLAATALLVKRLFFQNGEPERRESRWAVFDLLVWFFFLFVFVSIFESLSGTGGSRPCLNMLSAWLAMLTAWFLFRQTLYGRRVIGAALALVLAVTLGEAMIGLYQQFIDIPAMLRQFEADPAGTIAQVDPSILPDTPEWDRLVSRLKTAGPMGTYPMTNTLGGLLGTWLVFLIWLLLYQLLYRSNPSEKPEKFARLRSGLFLAVVALVLFCFVLTKCRSAYVAVAVGVCLLGVDFFRRRLAGQAGKRTILIGLAVLVLIGAAGALVGGKSVLAGAKRSLGFRLEYWEASMGMIRDYPLLGCGSGNFKQTYTRYKLPGSSEEIADPHNFVVEIAATAGLPALALFLAFFLLVPVRQLLRGLSTKMPPESETDEMDETETPQEISGADRWLFGGGLLGCWLAFAVSFNGEAPMDPMAPVFATVAFAVTGFIFLAPGRERTSLQNASITLLAVTVLVLCVHLLAAGGISVTNTAINFWLLAALLANSIPYRREREKPSRFHGISGIAVLVGAMVFVYTQSMIPVLRARSLSLQAADERNFSRKIELLKQAVKADSVSATQWEELAGAWFLAWAAQPENEKFKKETLNAQFWAVGRLSRSAGLRYIFAERLAVMYGKTGDVELQDRSLSLYREAIERYPNHARYRAPYALLLRAVAGDDAENRREARHQRDEALRLDDLMTHADQKLPEELRQKLLDPKMWE